MKYDVLELAKNITPLDENAVILAINPDMVFISNGPGAPENIPETILNYVYFPLKLISFQIQQELLFLFYKAFLDCLEPI